MNSFIRPPGRTPWYLRIGIWVSEKITGKEMLPARILAWVPKAAVASGVLESLVAHQDAGIGNRLLQLIRMQVSFMASCPFCIDMNSRDFAKQGISDDEIRALQGMQGLETVPSFSAREKTALEYVRSMTRTPVAFDEKLLIRLKERFTEREIVVIASTAAQVNYWTRLIQAFGVPPAGFSAECSVLRTDDFSTLKKGG